MLPTTTIDICVGSVVWMAGRAMGLARTEVPKLRYGVELIDLIRTEEEVAAPDARRVVALVQDIHALRHVAPSYAMGTDILTTNAEISIAICSVTCCHP